MALKRWTAEGVDPADVNKNNAFIFNQIFATSEASSRTTANAERYLRSALTGSLNNYASTTCFSKGDIAFVDSLYDSFDNGAIDATIWTETETGNGAVTEESTGVNGYLWCNSNPTPSESGTAIATADQGSATNFKTADTEILINLEMVTSGTAGNGVAYVRLTDGGNTVNLKGFNSTNSLSRTTLRIVIDVSTTDAFVYDSLTDTAPDTVDLSTLVGANWYLEFYTFNSGAPTYGRIKVYQIGILDGTGTETNYFSDAQSITSSNIGAFKVLSQTSLPTATARMSFNNGANYTAVLIGVTSDALNVESMTAGTQMILNISGRTPASINVNSTNAQSITNLLQVIYD